MRATKFDKKITVKRPVTEKTATGGIKESSQETVFESRARVRNIKGNKSIDYSRSKYSDNKEITLRKRTDDILTTDVIYYSSNQYEADPFSQRGDQRYFRLSTQGQGKDA